MTDKPKTMTIEFGDDGNVAMIAQGKVNSGDLLSIVFGIVDHMYACEYKENGKISYDLREYIVEGINKIISSVKKGKPYGHTIKIN